MTSLSQLPASRPRAVPADLGKARAPSVSPTLVLVIVCAGVVLATLDVFVVNVALPAIARSFHEGSLNSLSWVLDGYAIVYASLLVLAGRMADRYPRKYGFLLGVAVFTAASAACAAADNVATLVAFRLVQAAGAALLTPTSLSLVLAAYPAERRGGAVRAWTAVGGAAASLGPVVGGLLVAASWRWIFLINVPVGLTALAVGWRKLPDAPGEGVAHPDAVGTVLVTAGVGLLTWGLVESGPWGWGSAQTIGVLVGAVLLLGLFVVHCLTARNPLIEPGLFRFRNFSGASTVAIFFMAAFGVMLLSIVLWLQDAWGWSALKAGLAIAPGPLMVPLVSFGLAGRLSARFGPRLVVVAGLVLFAGGLLWWAASVGPGPDYVGGVLGGMITTGVGVGLTLPTMMATGTSSLPPRAFATGAATINMARQIGLALGVAVLVAILGTHAGSAAGLSEFRHGWIGGAILSLVGIAAAATLAGRESRA